MAPRSRSGAAQAAFSSSAAISSAAAIAALPEPVLARCLGFLKVWERQRVALVSTRFAAAANSPELLQELDIPFYRGVPELQSLASWLARHGRHIRKLRFCEDGGAMPSDEEDSTTEPFATCLQTVCAHGQLEELDAGINAGIHTEWLAAADSLRRLSLTGTLLLVSPAIAGLTALQSLKLYGALCFEAEAQLPPSLTRLSYWDEFVADDDVELPEMAQLTRLQRLKLGGYCLSPDSMSQLSALAGSLTWLDMRHTECPAASLAALTRLRHLKISTSNEESAPDVGSALPHLNSLTSLVLEATRQSRPVQLPTTLSCLSQLRACYLQGWRITTAAGKAPLPGGPWLHSLEWLGAGIDTLLASTAVLRQATRLEHLGLLGSWAAGAAAVDWQSPAASELLEWLACHPPLRRLSVEPDGWGNKQVFESNAFGTWAEQLRRRRPNLLMCVFELGWEGQPLSGRMYSESCF